MSSKSQPISDIFSVGIIFHYLLFGCSVFQGKKYNEILQQNRNCHLSFDKEMYSKLSPKTFDLLTRMLEKDPSKRISADTALGHPYFHSDMDVEFESKLQFKPSSFTANHPLRYREVETPTSGSCKKEEKYYYFNFTPK
jgi:serine/threonine protein kinase